MNRLERVVDEVPGVSPHLWVGLLVALAFEGLVGLLVWAVLT